MNRTVPAAPSAPHPIRPGLAWRAGAGRTATGLAGLDGLLSLARALALLLLFGAAAAPPAQAHQASDAFVTLTADGTALRQRVDIALRDLDREWALDQNEDGQLSWGEVRQRWPQIVQWADQAIQLDFAGQPCQPEAPAAPQLTRHSDGPHAVLQRVWRCSQPVGALGLRYTLFADSDATHRGILQLKTATGDQQRVLVPGAARVALQAGPATLATAPTAALTDTGPTSAAEALRTAAALPPDDNAAAPTSGLAGFVAEGVHHILIGYDHVLFLLTLLLPAVMLARGAGPQWPGAPAHALAPAGVPGVTGVSGTVPAPARWQAAPRLRPVLIEVAQMVTAFTVAHSITLALAVLDLWNPPSRAVEALIAFSVLLAALNNLWPVVRTGRWKITFAFGLVHGFGFAGALQDLGLDRSAMATSLLGFNLGVELGQLAIVGLALPLAWGLRGTAFYARWVLGGGSVLAAAVALLWLVERVFDLRLLG